MSAKGRKSNEKALYENEHRTQLENLIALYRLKGTNSFNLNA